MPTGGFEDASQRAGITEAGTRTRLTFSSSFNDGGDVDEDQDHDDDDVHLHPDDCFVERSGRI